MQHQSVAITNSDYCLDVTQQVLYVHCYTNNRHIFFSKTEIFLHLKVREVCEHKSHSCIEYAYLQTRIEL